MIETQGHKDKEKISENPLSYKMIGDDIEVKGIKRVINDSPLCVFAPLCFINL
jgi:hypothetical protein